MGQEIVYCFQCRGRILGADFEKGAAFQVGDRVTCAACAGDVLAKLEGKEREALLAKMFKSTQGRAPAPPPLRKPSSSAKHVVVDSAAPRTPKPPVWIYSVGGLALILIAAAVLSSRRAPPAPPPVAPAPKPAPPPADAAARELEKIDDAVRSRLEREDYGGALAAIQDARKRRAEASWTSALDKRATDVEAAAARVSAMLSAQAAEAKTKGANDEVEKIRARVARWGLPRETAALDRALAAAPGPAPLYRASADGLVCFEAEAHHGNVPTEAARWDPVAAPPGFTGKGAMIALPDVGKNIPTEYEARTPRLDYRIHVARPGTYHVWLRAVAAKDHDDSVHAGLDGRGTTAADGIKLPLGTKWYWVNRVASSGPAVVQIATPGLHVFSLWMREDGAAIDRILLTSDPRYVPSGDGPPVSGP